MNGDSKNFHKVNKLVESDHEDENEKDSDKEKDKSKLQKIIL